MINTVTGVTTVEMNLIPLEFQDIIGTDQSFFKVLLMLNMAKCFISGILVATVCNEWSFRFEMFRDFIKLILSILEWDL